MTGEARGIGAMLKAAREEKGWTVGDVSGRLRLMSRQIEAMEAEEFSKLGQPVFARGFVRNYAKLLGIDPDELLDQMTQVRAPEPQQKEDVPFKPGEEFWKSPWILGGIAALIMLLAIPVGLYLWLNSDVEEPVAAAIEKPLPPPPPPPAPVLEAPTGVPLTGAPAQPDVPAVGNQTVPTPPQPSAPATAASQAPQPAVPKPVPAPAQPQQAYAPAAPAPVARPPLPFPAPVAQPPTPPQSAPAPKPTPAPAKDSAVRMQFDQAAWVQVRDSTGRTVHSGMNLAGSAVEVSGKAPFYLVIGNAAHVRVSYKGQPVDLTPYIDVTVARLTLNP